MAGLKLFELGDLDITTGGSSVNIGGMTSIGVSEINSISSGSDSITINSGTSIFFEIDGGTSGVVIEADGYVGIGTRSPDALLHCKSSASNNSSGLESLDQISLLLSNSESHSCALVMNKASGNPSLAFLFTNTPSDFGTHSEKAYIKSNGTNQQLNSFTGQHYNLMNENITDSSIGLVVSAANNYINLDNSIVPKINESLPYCVLSNINNDKKVFGVISNKEDTNSSRDYSTGNFVSVYQKTNTNEQRFFINSAGEGAIWVCNKNGTLDNGDYITSTNVLGYGGKQADPSLHNYTVSKITCDCDFSLTKIVKQKLKTIDTTSGQEIVYDSNGDPEFENDLDPDGNIQMVYPYQTRFLQADGTLLIDQTDYETRLSNGEAVYIACFVGCTYHCG